MVQPDHVPLHAAGKTKRPSDRTGRRESADVCVGALSKLARSISDAVGTNKAGHMDTSRKLMAVYPTKKYWRRGNRGHTL